MSNASQNLTQFQPYDLARVLFCDYISYVTGRTTMLKHTNSPKMLGPYCVVNLQNVDMVDKDKMTFNQTPRITEEIRGLSIMSFTVEAYQGAVWDALTRLQSSFYTSWFVYGMEKYGFGLSDNGDINDTSSVLTDGRWETRAELKCSFYHYASDFFIAEYFDRMQVTVSVPEKGYVKIFDSNTNPFAEAQVCKLRPGG